MREILTYKNQLLACYAYEASQWRLHAAQPKASTRYKSV